MSQLQATIEHVQGFSVAGVHAGLKKDNTLDFALIVSDRDCASGAVFTKNQVKAAPVQVNMEHHTTTGDRIRAVAINTKSANAATGQRGLDNSRTMAQLTAKKIGCEAQQVFVMSTGVIGDHLPMGKIATGIDLSYSQLGDDWQSAATAIMTTDTRPKTASVTVETARGKYTIAGIVKGAGMIAPNMATMLSVIVTDAKLSPESTQQTLSKVNEKTYNRIVVDGDTSTNDMVVLLANGASGIEITSDDELVQFETALQHVAQYLAQAVVRDGEGVTKFITVHIAGAHSVADAQQIAHTIAASALVKTAFYGNDANWGRILMAAGRAGIPFDQTKLALWLATGETQPDDRGLMLLNNGTRTDYSEADATAIINAASVYMTLDLCAGDAEAIVWTCDYSHDYISINADYRT